MKKRYALLTVTDKTGIVEFAKGLKKFGFELVGSLKTSWLLRKNGISIKEVSEITGYPPIMGKQGIKLIHPIIFGGILADRLNPDHLKDGKRYKIKPFELVVCNLYAFEKTVAKKKFEHEEAIFNLDIGGPAMIRCAAKNYKNVTIVTDIKDYDMVLHKLAQNREIDLATNEKLALKAFEYVGAYDRAIIKYLKNKFKVK